MGGLLIFVGFWCFVECLVVAAIGWFGVRCVMVALLRDVVVCVTTLFIRVFGLNGCNYFDSVV